MGDKIIQTPTKKAWSISKKQNEHVTLFSILLPTGYERLRYQMLNISHRCCIYALENSIMTYLSEIKKEIIVGM